jgi:hypothetical protein
MNAFSTCGDVLHPQGGAGKLAVVIAVVSLKILSEWLGRLRASLAQHVTLANGGVVYRHSTLREGDPKFTVAVVARHALELISRSALNFGCQPLPFSKYVLYSVSVGVHGRIYII